jgi:glycosyltransferase involved in cell wall biosynthesis
MRIIHFIPRLGGGGAERQLSYLAPEQARLDHEVHVCYLHTGEYLERLQSTRVVLHKLAGSGNYDIRIVPQMGDLMRHVRPDIVQSWLIQMDVLVGLLCRVSPCAWVMSERGSAHDYKTSLKCWLKSIVAGQAKAIVANSPGGKEYWDAKTRGQVQTHIIDNALPLGEIEKTVPQGALSNGDRAILYAGRLHTLKNIEALIRAYSLLPRKNCRLVICGEGSQRHALKELATSLGIEEGVVMRGHEPDVWGWMKRADVFVSVSRYEGAPNSVLEAMACGCPVVVSDIPAHREILDASTAILVDPDDPKAIAAAIERILDDGDDIQHMAARAKERVQGLSIEIMARRYLDLYAGLLGKA